MSLTGKDGCVRPAVCSPAGLCGFSALLRLDRAEQKEGGVRMKFNFIVRMMASWTCCAWQ